MYKKRFKKDRKIQHLWCKSIWNVRGSVGISWIHLFIWQLSSSFHFACSIVSRSRLTARTNRCMWHAPTRALSLAPFFFSFHTPPFLQACCSSPIHFCPSPHPTWRGASWRSMHALVAQNRLPRFLNAFRLDSLLTVCNFRYSAPNCIHVLFFFLIFFYSQNRQLARFLSFYYSHFYFYHWH